ncbi:hypothetical protein GE09DRAFT_1052111 [Coniochaeta sp. 2T2.1]|nr:hypothetical protein GE09DRAFT_1052111 [Coniochaeta sp. 2T2.1]
MATTTPYDTPPEYHGPLSAERDRPERDDENKLIAKAIKRENRRSLARIFLPKTLAAPQPRPFQWMISYHYFPEQYHAESIRNQTPWYLLLRCLFADLPEQLESGLGSTVSWRDHQVKVEYPTSNSKRNGFPLLKWGQRVVFSERTEEQPNWFTGRWLVVGYLWSDNREWARSEGRVGKLASPSNTVCMRAFEKLPPMLRPKSKRRYFSRFYQLDRASDSPEAVVTMFHRLSDYPYRHPPPALPETPVPERLSRACSLMNNEARDFLYGPSSQDPARDIWPGNTDHPSCKEDCRMQTAGLPSGGSASKPE